MVLPSKAKIIAIDNCNQLQNINFTEEITEYRLMGHIDCSDTVNWNDGKGFNPLVLNGVLNGNNREIRNLYINLPHKSEVGLFSHGRGLIKELNLVNATVIGLSNVGSLIGIANDSVLELIKKVFEFTTVAEELL